MTVGEKENHRAQSSFLDSADADAAGADNGND